MKTNITASIDTGLVARLDAFRAPLGVGRSAALEYLLEALPEVRTESPGDQVRLYFDSNGKQVSPGIHHDNPKFDMVAPAKDPDFASRFVMQSEVDQAIASGELGAPIDAAPAPVVEPESPVTKPHSPAPGKRGKST